MIFKLAVQEAYPELGIGEGGAVLQFSQEKFHLCNHTNKAENLSKTVASLVCSMAWCSLLSLFYFHHQEP